MNLRDLKPRTLRNIGFESRDKFFEWLKATDGKVLRENPDGLKQYVDAIPQDIWDAAFSQGARAILRRVDAIKED